jgi:hypothetical protein
VGFGLTNAVILNAIVVSGAAATTGAACTTGSSELATINAATLFKVSGFLISSRIRASTASTFSVWQVLQPRSSATYSIVYFTSMPTSVSDLTAQSFCNRPLAE